MPLYHLLHFVKQIIWQHTSSACATGFDSGNLRRSDDARNAQAAFGKAGFKRDIAGPSAIGCTCNHQHPKQFCVAAK